LIDRQTRAHITSNAGNRWTSLRIDSQAFIIATFFAFFSIFMTKATSASDLAMTAVGFQMAIEVTRNFDMAIRWSVTVETSMISAQRLLECCKIPAEVNESNQQLVKGPSEDMETGRGGRGSIEFKNVMMSYKAGLRNAINDLSFRVAPGQKIAVVGRTGAGKSSLL